jgi:hypothetical protein
MISRVLFTCIYKDDFIASLTPEEKLLFIYFLTNEYVNIIHCYQCSSRTISFDTGIDTPIIEKAKQKFENAGKMFFYKDFIYLKNADRYETYTGIKNEEAKRKIILRMSKDLLDWYNNLLDTPINTPIDRVYNHNRNHNQNQNQNHNQIVGGFKEKYKNVLSKIGS